jgi:cobalt ECF transporter T component CbiQ
MRLTESHKKSYLERNLERFTLLLQNTVFAEETARKDGWLQNLDARVKCAGLILLLVVSSTSRSITVIAGLYAFGLALAWGSHIFSVAFLRRAWIFMPLYTALIALPALFVTPGNPLWRMPTTGWTVTVQGSRAALFLLLRVAVSVSLMMLLFLTTPWPRLLKALRSLGCPRILVLLLMMTHRYIYLLLNTASSLFLARKSRKVGPEDWRATHQWLGSLLAALLQKSYHLSQEVYLAMLSRGFRGEPVLMDDFRLRKPDLVWLAAFAVIAGVALYAGTFRVSQ